MAILTARVRDHSDEYSTVRINTSDLVALDLFSVATGPASDFMDALEALTLGTVVEVRFSQATDTNPDTRPASDWAQRELGLRFFVTGENSGRKANITIPAPDLAAIDTIPGTDLADLTDQPVADMVTWLEANMAIVGANPSTGAPTYEGVVVDRAVVIGRSN